MAWGPLNTEVFYLGVDSIADFTELVGAFNFSAQYNSGLTTMQPVAGYYPIHMVQGTVDWQPSCFPVMLQQYRVRPPVVAPSREGVAVEVVLEGPQAPQMEDAPESVSSDNELSEYPLSDGDEHGRDLGAREADIPCSLWTVSGQGEEG